MSENTEGKKVVNVFPSVVRPAFHTVPNTGSKCVDLEKKLVRIRHTTKIGDPKSDNAQHVALDHLMDLSALTAEEILESAADARLIKHRNEMKGMSVKDILARFTTDYVWKITNAVKKSTDPLTKFNRDAERLSMAEHVEFLKNNYGLSDNEAKKLALKKFQPK